MGVINVYMSHYHAGALACDWLWVRFRLEDAIHLDFEIFFLTDRQKFDRQNYLILVD